MPKEPDELRRGSGSMAAAHAAPRCGARQGERAALPSACNGQWTVPQARRGIYWSADGRGLERCRRAPWKHGGRSAKARAAATERGEVRRLIAALRTLSSRTPES